MKDPDRAAFEAAYGKRRYFKPAEDLPPRQTTLFTIQAAEYISLSDYNDPAETVRRILHS